MATGPVPLGHVSGHLLHAERRVGSVGVRLPDVVDEPLQAAEGDLPLSRRPLVLQQGKDDEGVRSKVCRCGVCYDRDAVQRLPRRRGNSVAERAQRVKKFLRERKFVALAANANKVYPGLEVVLRPKYETAHAEHVTPHQVGSLAPF